MKVPNYKKTVKKNAKLAQLVSLREGKVKSFDKTSIYYRSTGNGFPIIFCSGFGVPNLFLKYIENFFKQNYQTIVWDYRGHGESENPKKIENSTVEALVEDCKAVLDRLKIKKAVLLGYSLGTQVIFEFYRRYPNRVAGLIACLGTYGRPMDTFFNSPYAKYLYEFVTLFATLFPKQGNWISRFLLKNPLSFQLGGLLKIVDTGLASKEDVAIYIDHILKLKPEFFTTFLESVQKHSTETILKKIKIPTLIIGAENDQFTPVWISKKMHRLIPKSELFILKKATHAAIVELPELINLRIEKFLRERVAQVKKNFIKKNHSI